MHGIYLVCLIGFAAPGEWPATKLWCGKVSFVQLSVACALIDVEVTVSIAVLYTIAGMCIVQDRMTFAIV